MVPPSSHRVSRVRWYSGYSRMPSASLTGFSPSMIGFPTPFSSHTAIPYAVLTPKVLLPSVWPLPISLATTFGISFDFSSSPYLDVSVQAVPLVNLWIQFTMTGLQPAGLLHSEISGSMPAYGSPEHIAVSCVLHRLPVPRHSPCALCSLTISLM